MTAALREYVVCPACKDPLLWGERDARCGGCGKSYPVVDAMPRFVTSSTHDNFAIQWKRFADVQLDSKNGTTCSRDRLLDQSGLMPEEFAGKVILEVGCGAGRFTEILLSFGASVIAVDYSAAVEACAGSNAGFSERGRLFNAQADVFALPFKKREFDIVIGYGMLQHTGDASKALGCLWECVKPGGLLLVDRYQLSLRAAHPVKYALRPLLKHFPDMTVLAFAEKTCSVLVPVQRFILRRLQGGGFKKYIRYLANRSLNSTYPINLEIGGTLKPDIAYRWSVLDTFDMWAPKYDQPATYSAWKRELEGLESGRVAICKSGGQGNVGVVRRVA